ncbi:Zinc finger protein 106 [Collichthys lucidus]|uniref:Zinc finger protein 106 n=1 Tax=Collichthys lucidus TaxID=240159 RepID=A0A4U5VHA3_COLLU|nr:Zinc finger protein 106 [Collichthys lucidus]
MARDRKCILCETVYVSKQEMDEHMRSMLHHRELEKLKGRDCGHECRVCKVTVVSLTDYASHISSPTHKQNVEAAERKNAGNDHEEDYFDPVLVDLIEKRKEQIRKDKEAAAAKLAQEEEDRRRKEEFQQRLKDAKERYRLECARKQQQQSQGFNGSTQQTSWYRGNRYNGRAAEAQPWQHGRQGKSATWHAQEPPNFQKWSSGAFAGGSLHSQGGWGNRQWEQGAISGNQRSRLPWLSNGGSSNGVYGWNNISQNPQRGRPLSFLGSTSVYPPFAQALSKFQNTGDNAGNNQGGQQGDEPQNGEGQTAEPDHNSSKSSKTFGSNPKLDKTCRWSPYPVTKSLESVPHKDTNPSSSEKHPKVPKVQKQDKAPEASASTRQPQPEQKPGQSTSSGPGEEEKCRHKTNPKTKPRDRSSSGSRSSSAQRDGQHNSASDPSSQTASKSLLHKDKKKSSVLGLNSGAQLSKASSQTLVQSKSTPAKQSGFNPQAPPVGLLQSRQERQLPETLKRARQIVLEKRASLERSRSNSVEKTLHIAEEQQRDHAQSQVGVNKENSCRQNAAKPNLPDSLGSEKPALQSSDSSQFLQSLQVSTSTMESSEAAALSKEDEESGKKGGKETDAMHAAEAGQSSESDTSRSGEAQAVSGSNTSTSHGRSDTEKDSGLKPTVRQLISSSGSRRNVNWEQVYQEVRKKQDKGKGMPRFGIEMVPLDQEDQSQEEGDIPLLEGFQWDALMETSTTSRKRSLSESSVTPASSHSLFTTLMSKEAAQKEVLDSEQQGSSLSPQGSKDSRRQEEVEQMLGQLDAKAKKQPEKLTSVTVKALQRSDSVLGDSSSGTEQYDGQGTGKRRRAAGDIPSAETSCLEHNSKRRKVKSKKERLQIDQLLAVSLREEELSHSLQTVDTSLIQARAALEAAYIEVQRLMVVKQQMTGEMNTLRNKRIEDSGGRASGQTKEEKMDSVEAEPCVPSSVMDSPAADPSPGPPAERASPPSSSLPFTPVVIKQEPQSPVHVSSEHDPADDITHCAHSTTPELPVASAAASPSGNITRRTVGAFHFVSVKCAAVLIQVHLKLLQMLPLISSRLLKESLKQEHNWETFSEPADCKESVSELVETTEKATQATRNCLSPLSDSKAAINLLSASSRGSEVASVNCAAPHSFETPSVPMPASPSELRNGKRVRKLKKRKVLKKAQGTEQPESSDTELDGEALRPRWLRTRRRQSSQVSTSTQPSEDRDADVNMEAVEEASGQLPPAIKQEKASPKRMVELPQAATAELTLNADLEESMEVTAACPQPHMDAPVPAPPPAQVPDSSKPEPEPQSLAYNEVTSTSDMDICKSSESDFPFPITNPKIAKSSSGMFIISGELLVSKESDASSDHGEDDLPTEGVFEGHQEAVNAMQIHNGLLYTCSGDRTVRVFDLVSHKCVGVFEGHTSKVSCLFVSAAPCLHHRLYSGSSDQTIRCYSLKTRELEQQFSLSDRVLCMHSHWKFLYAGLANGTVVTFNLKTNKQTDTFECHGPRGVSCLASSQEGARRILLVGSYDSTISVRDAKNGLLLRTLEGHTKTVLCMKVVNDLVFSGSSDQCVYAHNIHTGELVRVYKGHSHAVTVVSILGKVMVTACLDKLVRVYDLQSHEQLQVYGGHKDMVMCMAIHKNMIYTGGYDGSVQAVKLNLMQNYRCWWHGCSLVFGAMEHLQQHLIYDHTSAKFQKLPEEFFCARNSSKQGMHMQKRAEEQIELEP